MIKFYEHFLEHFRVTNREKGLQMCKHGGPCNESPVRCPKMSWIKGFLGKINLGHFYGELDAIDKIFRSFFSYIKKIKITLVLLNSSQFEQIRRVKEFGGGGGWRENVIFKLHFFGVISRKSKQQTTVPIILSSSN